jgi:hypothetical protein
MNDDSFSILKNGSGSATIGTSDPVHFNPKDAGAPQQASNAFFGFKPLPVPEPAAWLRRWRSFRNTNSPEGL